MSKHVQEIHRSFVELDDARKQLIEIIRMRVLKTLDRHSCREIMNSVYPNIHFSDDEKSRIRWRVFHDLRVVESGYNIDVMDAVQDNESMTVSYFLNEDYRRAYVSFMKTREGFELSQALSHILVSMMITDEYSEYLLSRHEHESVVDDANERSALFDEVQVIREAWDVCRRYNMLVDARKSRKLESVIVEPVMFDCNGEQLSFLTDELYFERMRVDCNTREAMTGQNLYNLHDDNGFCLLTKTNRDAKNLCDNILEVFAHCVRNQFFHDVYDWNKLLSLLMVSTKQPI